MGTTKTDISEDDFTLAMLKKAFPNLVARVTKLESELETFEYFKKRLLLMLLDIKPEVYCEKE